MGSLQEMLNKVIQGDCLEVMKNIPDNSIDTIITDPPYGLEFMGKDWDKFKEGENSYQLFSYNWAKECLRVAKPGATLLCFGGTRTWHRLACGIEDAGWEIRDTLMWLYGSGFPKSLNIGKEIDKRGGVVPDPEEFRDAVKKTMKEKGITRKQLEEALGNHTLDRYLTNSSQPAIPKYRDYIIIRDFLGLGNRFDDLFSLPAERKIIGKGRSGKTAIWQKEGGMGNYNITEPATPEAKLWNDWQSHGLKPAWEPIVMAMKPNEVSYANNALKWGVAGLNIDGGRIETKNNDGDILSTEADEIQNHKVQQGRFPTNVILECTCDEVVEGEEERTVGRTIRTPNKIYGGGRGTNIGNNKGEKVKNKFTIHTNPECPCYVLDAQNGNYASRFFYVAKASRAERNIGCKGFINTHPTVKPIKLMEYLCKLTKTPYGGIVLDPFGGSGTTALACIKTGRPFVLIEKEEEYCKIANARIQAIIRENNLLFKEGDLDE